ncbi:unnamed protein product [Prunus brigantina]
MDQKSIDSNTFKLWHDRLGHPGSTMMRRIITNSKGHPLLTKHITVSSDNLCQACSQGKLVIRPSQPKVDVESPSFLQRIQGDICGPIHPPCGPFRYFMVLVDASTRWSHVCLLSTRNMAFARLLAQIIKLRAQFPDYPIKSIRLDNALPLTGDIFRARFADCHFDETIFPLLGEEKSVPKEQGKLVHEEQRELSWAVPTLSHLDPRTTQCENERGRPLGSKDSVPRKRKLMAKVNPNEINGEPTIHDSNPPQRGQVLPEKENVLNETRTSEMAIVPESQEISINYTSTNELWNRNEILINNIFAFLVATEIIKDDDIEPCSIDECKRERQIGLSGKMQFRQN